MGFSSSQARLMSLTTRKHNIGRELMVLSSRKKAITSEAKEASIEYNNSFNASIFKWSQNGGATYTDITYDALMSPTAGVSGSNKPILLTNQDGKVVVNTRYMKYAQMISPSGEPGGDWESNRLTILEEITGIDSSQILATDTTKKAADEASEEASNAYNEMVKWKSKEPVVYTSFNDLIKKMPSNISDAYKDSGNIHVDSVAGFKSIMNSIKSSMVNLLSDEDFEIWQEACDAVYEVNSPSITDSKLLEAANNQSDAVIKGQVSNVNIDIKELFKQIISYYKNDGGDCKNDTNNQNLPPRVAIRDRSEGSGWSDWNDKMQIYIANYEAATAVEAEAADNYNQSMDSTEDRNLISFYDHLFTAIAEQGWIYDSNVDNGYTYLNEMLQNNYYNLTIMTENADYEEGSTALSKMNKYDYTIGTAYYNDNVIKVSDPNVRYEALAIYENKKTEINDKEKKIDDRMTRLQTELDAINAMIKGIESVRDHNSETFFNIFS